MESQSATELHWMTASDAAARIGAGSLSPVELVGALLERTAAVDPRIHAFVTLDAKGALEQARAAEAEIRRDGPRGPLHGLPVAVKDIIDVAGLPTTCHSKIRRDSIPARDAAVVTRLREAGAILLGKASTHEFALGGPSFDLPFPPARNPWDPTRHPGGSSSGCGAGLASGLFPLAIGTDTAGSVRNPAGACGVVGLKPTYGAIPCDGVFPLAPSLDHVGPMARTVEDAALLLSVIGDGFADVRADDGATLRGLRVGFVRHYHETDMPAAPEVAAALERAADIFAELGATIGEARLPPLAECAALSRVILQAEAWAIHADWLRSRPGDYGALARRRLLTGAFLTADDLAAAQDARQRMSARIDAALDAYDILLTANAMDLPCAIDDADTLARTYSRQARSPFNASGHPALGLMCGLSRDGLPLSMQLVAPRRAEALLLRAGRAYQRVTAWHDCHPEPAVREIKTIRRHG